MKIFKTCPWFATLAMGLCCAGAGFSYALVTSTDVHASGADARAVGTSCTRRPVEFVTGSDLGVTVVGTQFTRQIVVRFGFKPHRFQFGAVVPNAGITISEDGRLTGQLTAAGTEVMEIVTTDTTGGQISPSISSLFTLRGIEGVGNPTPLQFISPATLPTGVANEEYAFNLEANGGMPSYEYFVDAQDRLPSGMALTSAGLLYGKPTRPTTGAVSFDVLVIDGSGLVVTQTFNLTILSGTIGSEFIAMGGTFNLNFGREGGRDSVRLSMILNKAQLNNAGIRKKEDLDGIFFALRFGGVSLPPDIEIGAAGSGTKFEAKFNSEGEISFPNFNNKPSTPSDTSYQVLLNPTSGQLTVSFSSVSLIEGLGANFNTFDPIIPVSVLIGQSAAPVTPPAAPGTPPTAPTQPVNFNKTDVVQFQYRRRGSKGKGTARANEKLAPAGLFLVKKVDGNVRTVNTSTDLVRLKLSGFLRNPGGTPIRPNATDSVQLFVGDTCAGEFPASSLSLSGDQLSFVNTDPSAIIRMLVVDNKKGTFILETNEFTPFQIFREHFLVAGTPYTFPVTLTLAGSNPDPTFDGQTSVTIFRRGNKLRNK